MSTIINPDARDERARDLDDHGLNGLRLALVSLDAPAPPGAALLDLYFHNARHVQDILDDVTATPALAGQLFRVKGGQRLSAGPAVGQVQCTAVAAGESNDDGDLISLQLTIAPIGDYSSYTLELIYDPGLIDPFFSEIDFKFRPGCFTNDCNPAWERGRAAVPAPAIDYLAKDYDSFRHTLINAMAQRVPDWGVTSEADLDQVLIDLFAATADELSDYQDRVMNEAYLASARGRIALARHARLMDYHVHQGNQSSAWLVLTIEETAPPFTLNEDLLAWAGHPEIEEEWVYFATRERRLPAVQKTRFDPLWNALRLHTWSDARPALAAGATSADVVADIPGVGQPEAEALRDRINDGSLQRLLIEEKLNPLTGRDAGRDPRKRQWLRLKPTASALHDPLTGAWVTRLEWDVADALRFDYSFTTWCANAAVENVSLFHGNLVRVHQGLPVSAHFYEPGTELPLDAADVKHRHYRRWSLYGEERGALCELPLTPLAYLPTPVGGEVAPVSTLHVEVSEPGAIASDTWDEVISLVHSDDSAEEGDHLVVEVDEQQRSRLRFGDGINGRRLADGAVVHCDYQVSAGLAGNVGADAVIHFRPLALPLHEAIRAVRNPFDVTDARPPEAAQKVLRNAPEAYRARQLRAVTLADYVHRAEEVAGVARAVARYAWTGSWRTVRLCIDPVGTTALAPALRQAVAAHLEAVRLIGEDLEIRPPRLVPLAIEVSLCLHPDYWPQDMRYVLEQEFSDGYTPDGRRGFFHPDEWTFGQTLHRSQIEGRLHALAGVEHVITIQMRRFNDATPVIAAPLLIETVFDEIIEVRNDPDHQERGAIRFDIQGGRQ